MHRSSGRYSVQMAKRSNASQHPYSLLNLCEPQNGQMCLLDWLQSHLPYEEKHTSDQSSLQTSFVVDLSSATTESSSERSPEVCIKVTQSAEVMFFEFRTFFGEGKLLLLRVFAFSQLSNALAFYSSRSLTHWAILLSVVWLCELIVLRWKCQRIGVTLKHI